MEMNNIRTLNANVSIVAVPLSRKSESGIALQENNSTSAAVNEVAKDANCSNPDPPCPIEINCRQHTSI